MLGIGVPSSLGTAVRWGSATVQGKGEFMEQPQEPCVAARAAVVQSWGWIRDLVKRVLLPLPTVLTVLRAREAGEVSDHEPDTQVVVCDSPVIARKLSVDKADLLQSVCTVRTCSLGNSPGTSGGHVLNPKRWPFSRGRVGCSL